MLPSCSTFSKHTKAMKKSWKFMKNVIKMELDFENFVGMQTQFENYSIRKY